MDYSSQEVQDILLYCYYFLIYLGHHNLLSIIVTQGLVIQLHGLTYVRQFLLLLTNY